MPSTSALAGRRVVITRAPQQNEELARELEGRGARVMTLPLVHFAELSDFRAVDAAIAELQSFDWLIFTSGNAVRFFLGRCRKLGRWPAESKPRIAVVGAATRSVLEGEGLRAEHMPATFGGAALAGELAEFVAGKRVLLPRSDRAGQELPAQLRATGAAITDVVAYRTAEPETLDPAMLEAMWRGEADAITFFSPSAFEHFARALGDGVMLRMADAGLAFAAVGPTTAAAIRAAGLPVAAESAAATSAALVDALDSYFAERGDRYRRPR
jgi:uroporphyrinogen-III synthase